ncbi:hypothetical protein ABC374_09725 [Peribacillus sp. 1P06PB]|uniref:hypothetical protein n=1 Tax=Peribacillus sp. 1P06PB TaxID=3132296 RepID=UPI0039A260B5
MNSDQILVKFIHLLVNMEQILVKLTHLLVNLKQILVNSDITHEFEKFPHEIGANIRELGTLLVNKQFWRISIVIKFIMKTPV